MYHRKAHVVEAELVSENEVYKISVVKNKKYPFHAFCVHKETGTVVEQASNQKTHAIHLAETEMKIRIQNGECV
tara:strand:- start:711 stop:932 length:222 start_codon:yes stop_codon:yes gene_type:complete